MTSEKKKESGRDTALGRLFDLIDIDKSGEIDESELVACMRMMSESSKFDAKKALSGFKKIDTDKSGMVDRNEWIQYYVTHPKFKKMSELQFQDLFIAKAEKFIYRKTKLMEAFAKYDTNKSGNLTEKEVGGMLKNVKGGKVPSKAVKKMIKEMDKSNDGKVSCDEFVDFMFKKTYDLDNVNFDQRIEATIVGFRKMRIRALFYMYDKDGNENMSVNEFANMMRANGQADPSKIIEKFSQFDDSKDRNIDLEEFEETMEKLTAKLNDVQFRKCLTKMAC